MSYISMPRHHAYIASEDMKEDDMMAELSSYGLPYSKKLDDDLNTLHNSNSTSSGGTIKSIVEKHQAGILSALKLKEGSYEYNPTLLFDFSLLKTFINECDRLEGELFNILARFIDDRYENNTLILNGQIRYSYLILEHLEQISKYFNLTSIKELDPDTKEIEFIYKGSEYSLSFNINSDIEIYEIYIQFKCDKTRDINEVVLEYF